MIIRIATTLMLVATITLLGYSITTAQVKAANGATIRGAVVDTTPEQNPIPGVKVTVVSLATEKEYTTQTDKKGEYKITDLPAGRYMISYSKKGYGERVGKSKVVAAGGEIFARIKMRKKENIITDIHENSTNFVVQIVLTIILILMVLSGGK